LGASTSQRGICVLAGPAAASLAARLRQPGAPARRTCSPAGPVAGPGRDPAPCTPRK